MKIILALAFLSTPTVTVAQSPAALFSKVENSISQNEREWTLMGVFQWPRPQVSAAVYRWRLNQCEVVAWIIVEPSIERTIAGFHDDGFTREPGKAQTLDFGNES